MACEGSSFAIQPGEKTSCRISPIWSEIDLLQHPPNWASIKQSAAGPIQLGWFCRADLIYAFISYISKQLSWLRTQEVLLSRASVQDRPPPTWTFIYPWCYACRLSSLLNARKQIFLAYISRLYFSIAGIGYCEVGISVELWQLVASRISEANTLQCNYCKTPDCTLRSISEYSLP